MQFDIVTLFPEMFQGYLSQSILHKAIQRGIIGVRLVNLRDWSEDKHHRVDDRPYGGGPGMVLMVEPVVKCVEALQRDGHLPARVVLLTPQGKRFNQRVVEDLARSARLILLCGRYEGFDQRIVDILQPEEISLGDFILNGGEVAAMAVMDAVIRLVPEVLGDERSSLEESFSQQYPGLKAEQYTRPREFRGHTVPEVLLSGDHQAIARWRADRSRARTAARRDPPPVDGLPSRPDDV